jgi:hypothetical protein
MLRGGDVALRQSVSLDVSMTQAPLAAQLHEF